MFFCVLPTLCMIVFFQWHFIDVFSCIDASLFNKLTSKLLTGFQNSFADGLTGKEFSVLFFVSQCR